MGDWQKINDLFALALEQPIESRSEFLRENCEGSESVFAEVRSLLDAHDEQENLIEKNSIDLASNVAANGRSLAGKRFGNYKIVREIGRGGMGAVFLAERTDGEFDQEVALKIVRQTFVDAELEKRFRLERQILATLNHPHIARLLDGGVSEMGEPFLAMEYVEGEPLLEYAEDHNLETKDRLTLFLKICSAVAYAHRNLTVHRDIKPSNILVTWDGEPKLLDFGLAKMSESSPPGQEGWQPLWADGVVDHPKSGIDPNKDLRTFSERTTPSAKRGHPSFSKEGSLAQPAYAGVSDATQTAFRAFTPAYASPEQISGKNITTASDVYSLGVVLYELLTGDRPFHFEDKSFEEILRTIEASEPVKPSQNFHRGDAETQRKLNPNPQSAIQNPKSLRGDLDTIILKALRKEPELRYGGVEQFAEDIRRHLNDLPIQARPQTFSYRASRFVRRNKIAVGATLLILLFLVTGLAAALWQAKIARAERDRAELSAAKAMRISAFLEKLMLTASPSWNAPGYGRDQDITLVEVIDEAAERVKTEFAEQPDILAAIQHNLGITYISRGRYDAAESNLRAAYETSLGLYGEDHHETVQNMRDLAALLMLKGDYGQSDLHYQKALTIYRKRITEGKTEGNTLLGFAGSLNDVGLLHRLKGEPRIAETYLREALRQSENLMGNERAVLAIVLGHLGMARDDQGDSDAAEDFLRQSIEEFRRLPGNRRAETGNSLVNLGIILKDRGEHAEAETLIREGLELYGQLLGDAHPYTANAMSHLSDVQLLTGSYPAAEENARKSLEIAKRTLPEKHPNLAYPLTTLGLILTRRGQPATGEKYLREALEIRNRVMNKNFWRVAETEGALGECLTAQRKFANAEPFSRESYEKLQLSQGATNARGIMAERRLFALHKVWNKPKNLD